MILELRKIARMPRGAVDVVLQHLTTGLDPGEDRAWAFGGDVRADARRAVLDRIVREQAWCPAPEASKAAIFPRVIAEDVEVYLSSLDPKTFFWQEVVNGERLQTERLRKHQDRDARAEASVKEVQFKIPPEEAFRRMEREGLA